MLCVAYYLDIKKGYENFNFVVFVLCSIVAIVPAFNVIMLILIIVAMFRKIFETNYIKSVEKKIDKIIRG